MKIRVYEEVSIDTEVNVDVDELLSECWQRIEEAEEGQRRAVFGVVDSATKILAAVPDSVLELAPPEAIAEVVRRLDVERKRWASLGAVSAR